MAQPPPPYNNYPVNGPPQPYPGPGPYQQPPHGYPPQANPPQVYPPPSYHPPPQGFPPQQGQYGSPVVTQPMAHQQTVVAIGNPPVMFAPSFGELPVSMTCPGCHCQIQTTTIYTVGGLTWLIVCVLFFFGIWPCCLIPFCVNGCKDVSHSCPSCNRHLGIYRRL